MCISQGRGRWDGQGGEHLLLEVMFLSSNFSENPLLPLAITSFQEEIHRTLQGLKLKEPGLLLSSVEQIPCCCWRVLRKKPSLCNLLIVTFNGKESPRQQDCRMAKTASQNCSQQVAGFLRVL